jgi:hypothetical protein
VPGALTASERTLEPAVRRYIELGLSLGRHVDGLVDAYYGPPDLADRAAAVPPVAPARLAEDARRLLADLEGDTDLTPERRHWLAAQVRGLRTTAARLAGAPIGYSDEVEACYGVRPRRVPEDDFTAAHRALDEALPGTGDLRDRYIAWREAQAVPVDRLEAAVSSLAEDLRARTDGLFGLPEGERIDFELVTDKPWSGFNYYLGDLRSRVAINVDLPVLSTVLAHLVAHESYPGHHTEHTRKEAGLVRRRSHLEETIFLVGTPQCLLAEGLADLGLEIVVSERPEPAVAEHLGPLGIPYDPDVVMRVREAGEALGGVRTNLCLMIHEDGARPDQAITYAERWALLPRARAEKMVEFLTDPTWRAYTTCYVEGLALCRRWVAGDPGRFERLITEQLTPDQLTPDQLL